MNTREYWGFKTVAPMPDGTGKHRVSFSVFTDMYAHNRDDLVAYVAMPHRLPSKLLGPMSREEWNALEANRCGYSDTCDLDAPVTMSDWDKSWRAA